MPDDVESLLDRVCELIHRRMDPDCIATAKRRQADMFAGRASDYIPMDFSRPVHEADNLPNFDWRRRFHEPAVSLYMQLKNIVLPRVASKGDFVPGLRADLGTINCQSVLGARYLVPEHTRTVICEYVPKETLAEMEPPDDISALGTMPRIIEHTQHHLAALRQRGLGELVGLYHCDQQGPFDIAAMTRGHDIFIDVYTDPDFVHKLMRLCTNTYIRVTKLAKDLVGSPHDHGNVVGFWMENGGVRICGDSDILVSAAHYREFIQPYQREAFDAFGGGWMHYCGGWKGTGRREGLHLHEAYAEIESLRGLNWTTAGDWIGELTGLRRMGVAHLGGVPREDGEGLREYLRRILSAYDRRWGLVFGGWVGRPDLAEDEFDVTMDIWHEVQDEVFG